MKNTLTSNPNNEETKKLLGEIWKIRQEIKNSTMWHFKENIPKPSLGTYLDISTQDVDTVLQEKENICKNSTIALDCLKLEYDRNVAQVKREDKEFTTYKSQFKKDITEMETELDLKLSQIKHLNQLMINDNKRLASEHKNDIQELKDYYDYKLLVINDENNKSKQTFQELISSREAELTRINQEIQKFIRDQESKKQKLNGKILEDKEHAKVVNKKRKISVGDFREYQVKNSELQKENSLKIRKLRRLRAQTSHLKEANVAIKLGIDKLTGVAYGKGHRPKTTKPKAKKLNKTKAKGMVKPTKMFVLQLSQKLKPKKMSKSRSKQRVLLGSQSTNTLKRKNCKSVIRNSRPIFTKLQDRLRAQEDVYQMQACTNLLDNSESNTRF